MTETVSLAAQRRATTSSRGQPVERGHLIEIGPFEGAGHHHLAAADRRRSGWRAACRVAPQHIFNRGGVHVRITQGHHDGGEAADRVE